MTEEEKREEEMSAARGMFWGTVLGSFIWIVVLAVVYYVAH